MPSLSELQTAFARAMIERDEGARIAEWIVSGHGLDAQARIAVYRNKVLSNYRATLGEVYPVVLALVGEPFFSRAAEIYASAYPSRSGDLNDFGGEFGEFLAEWPPAAQLAYLPDVARLEWAVERVFHAADALPLDLRALAAVSQEELPGLRFTLHPGSRIVCSPYPILGIWQVNQSGYSGGQSVHLDAGGDALLVIRRDATVELEPLRPGALTLLRALAADLTLAQAHAVALEADPALDLAALLQKHILGGTLVAFRNDRRGVTT
jgi:hypothetical protein